MSIYGIHYNRAWHQTGESRESLLGPTRQTMDEKKMLLPELVFLPRIMSREHEGGSGRRKHGKMEGKECRRSLSLVSRLLVVTLI